MEASLGLDVGAVSTNLAVLDTGLNVVEERYQRSEGLPIASIQKIMKAVREQGEDFKIVACGTTGSGRHLAAALVGLRGFVRVRRRRCPACAYPMGDSPVCTECGKPLPQRAVP